jgi:hypothetical protein
MHEIHQPAASYKGFDPDRFVDLNGSDRMGEIQNEHGKKKYRGKKFYEKVSRRDFHFTIAALAAEQQP